MKVFLAYGINESPLKIENIDTSSSTLAKEWEVNLTYANFLRNELEKYTFFEIIGPLKKTDGQLMFLEEEEVEIQSHQPNLIIRFSVRSQRIPLLENIIKFNHKGSENKYTLFILMESKEKKMILFAQLIDEYLTKKIRVNNYIKNEQLLNKMN